MGYAFVGQSLGILLYMLFMRSAFGLLFLKQLGVAVLHPRRGLRPFGRRNGALQSRLHSSSPRLRAPPRAYLLPVHHQLHALSRARGRHLRHRSRARRDGTPPGGRLSRRFAQHLPGAASDSRCLGPGRHRPPPASQLPDRISGQPRVSGMRRWRCCPGRIPYQRDRQPSDSPEARSADNEGACPSRLWNRSTRRV